MLIDYAIIKKIKKGHEGLIAQNNKASFIKLETNLPSLSWSYDYKFHEYTIIFLGSSAYILPYC